MVYHIHLNITFKNVLLKNHNDNFIRNHDYQELP